MPEFTRFPDVRHPAVDRGRLEREIFGLLAGSRNAAGTRFCKVEPGRPETSHVTAAGNRGKIVHMLQNIVEIEAVEQPQIESGAPYPSAGKRQPEMIVLGENHPRFITGTRLSSPEIGGQRVPVVDFRGPVFGMKLLEFGIDQVVEFGPLPRG